MNYRDVAQKYAEQHLGVKGSIKKLGNGSYAQVFEAGGLAIKVTRDSHDAIVSQRTRNKGFKHIVKNYDVFELSELIEGNVIYVIVNEKLNSIQKGEDWKGVRRFIDDVYITDSFYDDKDCEREFNTVGDEVSSSMKLSKVARFNVTRTIPQFITMMRELASLELRRIDFHWGNVGYDDNGLVKFLDLGHFSSNGDSRGIKVLQL